MDETRKVIEENIGTLELRGTQLWICYESLSWGSKWRLIADFAPLVGMMREGLEAPSAASLGREK